MVPCCACPGERGGNKSNADSSMAQQQVRSKAAKIRGSNYRIIRYLPRSGFSGGNAGFGYGMIVFTGTSADADGAYHLSATLNRNATREDHDLAVVRSVNAKELLTRLRILTQRFCIQIEGAGGESLFLRDVDAANPGSIHPLERDQVGARIDHGNVHHDLDLVGLFGGRGDNLARFF